MSGMKLTLDLSKGPVWLITHLRCPWDKIKKCTGHVV